MTKYDPPTTIKDGVTEGFHEWDQFRPTTGVVDAKTDLMRLHADMCCEARALMDRKNHDYTDGSADPYLNFRDSKGLGVHPGIGLMIRMRDKMQRIRTFINKGELRVENEGLKDSCIDMINYTILLYGLLTEEQDG